MMPLDLNVLIAAGGFVVSLIGLAFAGWRWIAGTLRAVEAETKTHLVMMQAQLDIVRSHLSEFKIEVANHYVSTARLHPLELKVDRVNENISALTATVSRLVGRMERDRDERSDGHT
jgi:uncharacterized membrane-anchored protein YhcB (DUF1043 family)